MTDDEEALTWAGDEERGRGNRPVREPASRPTDEPDDGEAAPRGGALLLVTYGILAGVYAICTVGWITTVLRSPTTLSSLPAEIMYQFGEFLAIALPALWFVTVLWLERRAQRRLLWLLIGVPLVLPWPWMLGI